MNRKPAGSHHLRLNICLPPAVAERLRELGDGNLSAGIREALQGYQPPFHRPRWNAR